MNSRHKTLKWLGIGLAGLGCLSVVLAIVAGIVYLVSLPHILQSKVQAEIASIKARSEPVAMADLAGPRIPDSQNAAVIYERIFREMDKPRVKKDFEFLTNRNWKRDSRVGAEDKKVLVRTQMLIPLLEEAVSRPKCRFHLDWSVRPFMVSLPHLAKLRKLELFLQGNALMNAEEGNMAASVRSLRIAFMMSESLKDEPGISPQLVRSSQIAIASAGLRESMQRGSIGSTEARLLFDALASVDVRSGAATALKGERAWGISFFNGMRDYPDVWPFSMGADELFYIRTMNKWIRVADLPYRVLKSRRLDRTLDPSVPRYALMSGILLPPLLSFKTLESANARIAGSRVFLALAAYKDRLHEYPKSLAELRVRLGWRIPEDPFSGGDFIYKRRGKGFILYSIGPNLKDDGGKASPTSDADDIVWRMDH